MTPTSCRRPAARELGDELRDTIGRPLLRMAVRGAGREPDDRVGRRQAGVRENRVGLRECGRTRRDSGPGIVVRAPDLEGAHELEVVLDLVHRGAGRGCAARQQPSASRRAIAPTLLDATAACDPRAAERVGQEQDRVDARLALLRRLPRAIDRQDFVGTHGSLFLEERCDRRHRREHDRFSFERTTDGRHGRNRHHGVAKPVRCADQQALDVSHDLARDACCVSLYTLIPLPSTPPGTCRARNPARTRRRATGGASRATGRDSGGRTSRARPCIAA